MDADTRYLEGCWEDGFAPETDLNPVLIQHHHIRQNLVPEIVGFTVYTILFGELSRACLNFLFRSLNKYPSSFPYNQFPVSILSLQEQGKGLPPLSCYWLLHCHILL
jgi:hypothetical protein